MIFQKVLCLLLSDRALCQLTEYGRLLQLVHRIIIWIASACWFLALLSNARKGWCTNFLKRRSIISYKIQWHSILLHPKFILKWSIEIFVWVNINTSWCRAYGLAKVVWTFITIFLYYRHGVKTVFLIDWFFTLVFSWRRCRISWLLF